MPYEVLMDRKRASEKSEALLSESTLLLHVKLKPHQSLSPEGFVTFIGITFMMMLVPLTVLIGSGLWWGVMPFVVGALAFCWFMLKRSWKDGQLTEDLRLWEDRIEIHRCNPRKNDQHWEANPYWVKLSMKDGPVESYVTLKGNDREVELGRFLSPEERRHLHGLISKYI